MLYLIVFIGAGIGGALRHGVNVGAARLFGFGFPFGTLIVNVVGSFVMGLLAGYFAFRPGHQPARAAVPHHRDPRRLHDLLGLLARHGIARSSGIAYGLAAGYVVGSVAAGLSALFFGLALFRGGGHLP